MQKKGGEKKFVIIIKSLVKTPKRPILLTANTKKSDTLVILPQCNVINEFENVQIVSSFAMVGYKYTKEGRKLTRKVI